MAATLGDWNFADEELNGATALINRQKSATDLVVLSLDEPGECGVFLDRVKGLQSTASLSTCDCRDFHFIGRSPRKTFQPCKHIYRLAMELRLLTPKYLDHDARDALRSRRLEELKRREDDRLHSLGRDPAGWGGWPEAMHKSGLQQNRQYRAYVILADEPDSIMRQGASWRVREYVTSLAECECADFRDRDLPCKHIYAVALASEIALALSRAAFSEARECGREVVFEFENERLDPRDKI